MSKNQKIVLIILAVALLIVFFLPSKAAKKNAAVYNDPATPPAPTPSPDPVVIPKPDISNVATVKLGSSGPYVTFLQALINYVNVAFGKLPPLVVDGKFGPKTEAAAEKMFRKKAFTTAEILKWNEMWKAYQAQPNIPSTVLQTSLKNLGIYI